MAKAEKKPKGGARAGKFYKVSGGKVERTGKLCDRCGSGTFMADHKDRWYCGKCQMTVWKKKE
jgi:small subunit ribosomal protein S27Ae